jgi:streptogramin lyase
MTPRSLSSWVLKLAWSAVFQSLLLGMSAIPASAQIDAEYPLSRGVSLKGIVWGPDGNFWFTEWATGKIGKITPDGQTITEYPIPTPVSQPVGITRGPDGNVWFTEPSKDKIGRINPADGSIVEYDIPISGGYAQAITTGPDGNLWFVELNGNKIGRISSDGQTLNEFPIPTPGAGPADITTGADGNLWFTENGADQIGRITPAGVITEFPTPSENSYPERITAGPDGNLWFTEPNRAQIGRITPDGVVIEFRTPDAIDSPEGIITGPDGNLWFSAEFSSKIGRITPTGVFTMFTTTTANSGPTAITAGPDAVWFIEESVDRLGKKTTGSLTITEFAIPTQNSGPLGITVDPSHASRLWFTEFSANQIARMTTDGSITPGDEFPVLCDDPTNCNPGPREIIGTDSGCCVMFTEFFAGAVETMALDGTSPSVQNIPTPQSLPVGISSNYYVTETYGNQIFSNNDPIQEIPIPTSSSGPLGITVGPDLNLWFTEAGVGVHQIGRYDNAAGQVTEFLIPSGGTPQEITFDYNTNTVWFTEVAVNGIIGNDKIARMDKTGTVIGEFTIPTPNSQPFGIVASPDGNVYFTEIHGNKIGRLTPDGRITEFLIPTPNSQPFHLTIGPDGNVWFTEFSGNKIGRLFVPH